MIRQINKQAEKNNQAGFSLIELLVVMVVMLIVLSAVFALMRGSIISANANYEMTSAAQGLRNSQEFLTRDILVAGDGFKGISNVFLPMAFITKYLTIQPASALDPTDTGYANIGSILADNNLPAGVNVLGTDPANTISSIKPNTDRLTLLAIDPNFSSIDIPVGAVNLTLGRIAIPASRIGDFQAGEIYYVTSGGTGVFGTVTSVNTTSNAIFWAEGDLLGLNRLGTSGLLAAGTDLGTSPASLRRVNIINYFVDADSRLIRRVFGVRGASFIDNVIAEHLVSLQFQYVLEPSADGTIFKQPETQFPPDQASRVRMIEPSVSVETAYALQDGVKRQVEGTTRVGVRNIQFLEAPVPMDAEGNPALLDPGPTPFLTPEPTPTPEASPTATPLTVPSPAASATPTVNPTPSPTPTPAKSPTPTPTATPCKNKKC